MTDQLTMLQSAGRNVTKMATKVRLASQYVVVANDAWFVPLVESVINEECDPYHRSDTLTRRFNYLRLEGCVRFFKSNIHLSIIITFSF